MRAFVVWMVLCRFVVSHAYLTDVQTRISPSRIILSGYPAMFARGWFSFISGSLATLKRRLARKKCTLPRSEVAKCDTGGVRPTHKQVCLITFQIGDGGVAVAKLYLMKTKI